MGDGLDGRGVVTGEVEGAAFEGGADAGGETTHHFLIREGVVEKKGP